MNDRFFSTCDLGGGRSIDGMLQRCLFSTLFLLTCVFALGQRVRDIEFYGSQMKAEEALALEASLRARPDDEISRVQLYSYYSRKYQDPEAEKSRLQHALWLIEKAPRLEVHRTLYISFDPEKNEAPFKQARDLWTAHIEKNGDDLAILEHGGLFLLRSDPDAARELFLRGQKAEPEEPRWPNHLGRIDLRTMNIFKENPDKQKQLAAQAFESFVRSYELSNLGGRTLLLPRLCQTALRSEQYALAEEYANRMLSQEGAGPFGYQKNHYHGHTVLGVLKFMAGDIDEARRLLMRSLELPPSSRAMTSEPDFSLVRRFIERGDGETAAMFFKACEDVWEKGQSRLRDWQEMLENGETLVLEHAGMY